MDYLSAVANMGMGNNVNALNLARQASSMEPGNPEYSNLVNRLQWNSQRYQGAAVLTQTTAALPAVRETSAVICGALTVCVSVWEEIFVHACKRKENGRIRPFDGLVGGYDYTQRCSGF